jgi:DNA replication and repair protein RecF
LFISNLKINNFRNIKFKEYEFTKNINIFYGDNGAGKTSILESIYFLSTAKSFRKSSSKSLINFESDSVTVYSKTLDKTVNTFAVSKNKTGKWSGKINNSSIQKQSQLSPYLKVIAIDPEVYRLVDFGPQYRRSYLDWFVFHVEHNYLSLWKKTFKCIKHLNSLYKNKASNTEIEAWESSLIKFVHLLDKKREFHFNLIKPKILKLIHIIQTEINNVIIEYKKGWNDSLSFAEQLKSDKYRNLKYGQLQNGPHKMDIKISVNKFPAAQTLSRGQKKALSIIFYLSYIDSLIKKSKSKPIVCLDDLDAEIDQSKLKKIGVVLKDLNVQLFITTVDFNKIKNIFSDTDVFHVEHP